MISLETLKKELFCTCVFLGILPLAPIGLHAQEPPLALIQGCTTCHGAKGIGAGDIPTIQGLGSEYFIAQMNAFRTSTEGIMPRFATGLSDSDLAALAKWFEEAAQ